MDVHRTVCDECQSEHGPEWPQLAEVTGFLTVRRNGQTHDIQVDFTACSEACTLKRLHHTVIVPARNTTKEDTPCAS
jgi:hypothetical protein